MEKESEKKMAEIEGLLNLLLLSSSLFLFYVFSTKGLVNVSFIISILLVTDLLM